VLWHDAVMTAFLLLWLAAQAVSVLFVWLFTIGLGRPVSVSTLPPVAVIVAVKGHGSVLDGFLGRLFEQDYPFFRVIFAVESAADPAVAAMMPYCSKYPERIDLVIAGLSSDEGQKVANLRAALLHVTSADEILLFADADIWPERDWLKRLIAPLVRGEADVVSGYTWLVAHDRHLATFVMASMSAALVTIPRLPLFNAAWGGSTAIWRDQFDALGIAQAWRGTLSDDLQLTQVAKRAGCTIAAPREILPRIAVTTGGFAAVADDALRWFMLFRVHMPATYAIALVTMTFLAVGWVVAIIGALAGQGTGLAALMAAFVLALMRTAGRAVIVARLWGRTGLRENGLFWAIDPVVTPLASILNAVYGWCALFLRQTTWAGITYEIRGPQQVKVLSRRSAN